MTQQDNWRPEMARLAQRQDLLERQQRETTARVEALNRDIDSGIENLRWNADLRLKDMEWNADLRLKDLGQRVASLECFRGFTESLIMYAIMIGCGVALAIFIVMIVVEARGGRQENGQPEERSLISLRASPGVQVQPGLPQVAQVSTAPVTQIGSVFDSSTGWLVPGIGQVGNINYGLASGSKASPVATNPQSLRTNTMGSLKESLLTKKAWLNEKRDLGLVCPLVRVQLGGPDLTKSRTEADSVVTPSFGMGTVYVSVASSPTTSMPSTKLLMSALRSGNVPSFRKSRKSPTYSAISSVLGRATLRCSS